MLSSARSDMLSARYGKHVAAYGANVFGWVGAV